MNLPECGNFLLGIAFRKTRIPCSNRNVQESVQQLVLWATIVVGLEMVMEEIVRTLLGPTIPKSNLKRGL